MNRRSMKLIIFGLCTGALIGTFVGNILAFLLPDGSAVKQFFLISYDFTFGSMKLEKIVLLHYHPVIEKQEYFQQKFLLKLQYKDQK